MTYKLGLRSLYRLRGVHPDLVAVVKRAIEITDTDFTVLEGLRSPARQKKLVQAGKSMTLNSRHLTGHAVDLAPYPITWEWPLYYKIAAAMKKASTELYTPIVWGGDWKRFKDGPHFELDRKEYP